jgi:hypothetical protein
MAELAYPVGHPANPEYKGAPWANTDSPVDVDFPPNHPARSGANVRPIDTPDGHRAAHNAQAQDLNQLAMMGSLPPVVDHETGKPLELAPEQLAHIYAVRKGLLAPLAAEMTQRYGLQPEPQVMGGPAEPAPTAEDLALQYIMGLGYLPERAKEILARYGVPDVVAQHVADENR